MKNKINCDLISLMTLQVVLYMYVEFVLKKNDNKFRFLA